MEAGYVQKRPPLQRQVGWTLFGNVAYAACQWAILIVFAKAVSPAMVGQFGLGLAISTPLLMFTNLQLRSLQATSAAQDLEFQDYLGFRLASTGLAFAVILGLSVSIGTRPSTALVIVVVGLAKCVESIADTVYGQLQRSEMMRRIALSMVARGGLSLVATGAVVLMTRSMFWACVALTCASSIVLFAYDLRVVAQPRLGLLPRWKAPQFRTIVRLGLPLGVASLFLALAINIPRYMLEHSYGEGALGYFSALGYPTAAFSILLSAFGQAATPRMAESYLTDRRKYWRIVMVLSAVPILTCLGLGLTILVFGPAILTHLYRSDYAAYFDVFLLLLLAGGLWALASVLGYAATASHRLKGQAPVSIAVCVAAIAAGALAIPTHGIRGAAFASVSTAGAAIVLYSLILMGRSDHRTVENQ